MTREDKGALTLSASGPKIVNVAKAHGLAGEASSSQPLHHYLLAACVIRCNRRTLYELPC